MLFQAHYRLDPWRFDPPVASFAPVRFDLNSEKFSLYIEYIHAREGERDAALQLRTLYRCDDVPSDVAEIFADGQGSPLDIILKGSEGWSAYPSSYREFVLRLHQHMDLAATNLFNVIRWRFGVVGGPLSLSSDWKLMRWHNGPATGSPFDEHGFLSRQIPTVVFTLALPEMQEAFLNQRSVETIEEMFHVGTTQPLYHDLFREAWQSRGETPRSSLVMGMAAIETALKTTAVDLFDNAGTEWIFENLPSPPIDRMLRDYVQLLPARRKIKDTVKRPPTSSIKLIKQGLEVRNKLVHGRGNNVDPELLGTILRSVRDVLYLLDYYRGHDWALERCSEIFLEELRKSDA